MVLRVQMPVRPFLLLTAKEAVVLSIGVSQLSIVLIVCSSVTISSSRHHAFHPAAHRTTLWCQGWSSTGVTREHCQVLELQSR
jgi:hypothetical protein